MKPTADQLEGCPEGKEKEICTLKCKDQFSGNFTLLMCTNGTWNGDPPECKSNKQFFEQSNFIKHNAANKMLLDLFSSFFCFLSRAIYNIKNISSPEWSEKSMDVMRIFHDFGIFFIPPSPSQPQKKRNTFFFSKHLLLFCKQKKNFLNEIVTITPKMVRRPKGVLHKWTSKSHLVYFVQIVTYVQKLKKNCKKYLYICRLCKINL